MFARSKTFTTEALFDVDAVKTSVATVADAVSYSGAGLNGASVSDGVASPLLGGHTGFASYPSCSRADNASSYVNESTATLTGTYRGQAVTRTITFSGTDGDDKTLADGPMDTITQIDIEAQADTGGAFEFGWSGLVAPQQLNKGVRWLLVANETGAFIVEYGGGLQDTVTLQAGAELKSTPHRILETSGNFTLYE